MKRQPSQASATAPALASTRRRRGVLAAVLAVVLGLGGGTAGYTLGQQDGAPRSTASTAGAPRADQAVPSSARPDGPVLAAARPRRIDIPAIGVSSPVNRVGLNPDDTMQVPQPGPLYDQAAWYQHSPTPGEVGPSVVIGHIDSATDGPSVFYRLDDLEPGQRVHVDRADGTRATFAIDSVRSYPKESFPHQVVYGNTDHSALRLITCGGIFNDVTNNYRSNTVVFAHLVDTAGPS